MLRFDNRVAVITGAGGGLGKAYAQLLSSLGAKVVVNDLGGSLSGGAGSSNRAADLVVNELRAAGGEAVANYDSVEHGDKIIETAIKHFGRIDILINNAGILRDKSLAKMSIEDWDLIMLVHLKGSFSCTKAAWPYMYKQGYGRIVNTASAAGLYGNFGQANYSAAKIALVGFTKSIAAEGERKGIFSNVIAPIAGTRMTETILPKEIVNSLKPEYIAPVVAYLCHEKCSDNGSVVELGAGWVSKLRWQRTAGHLFPKGYTPDDVQKQWNIISDFNKNVTYPTSLQESLVMMTQTLASGGEGGKNEREGGNSDKGEKSGGGGGPIEGVTLPQITGKESKADKLFILMSGYMQLNNGEEGKKISQKINAKFFWDITEKKGGPVKSSWTIDLRNGNVARGKEGKADVTFTMKEDDFISVCTGKLNPQVAFMKGQMKISGNMGLAVKFNPTLFPKIDNALLEMSIEEAARTYLEKLGTKGGGGEEKQKDVKNSEGGASGSTPLKSDSLIAFMTKHLSTNEGKALSKRVGHIYRFDIIPSKGKPPVSFTIDLKNSPPSIKSEAPKSQDAQFTMLDDDFVKVVTGKLNPQIAFVQGKMKIKGNMKAAMLFTPDLFPKPSAL